MILVDANLLIYAFDQGCAQHSPAQQWLDEALLTQPRVALPWPSLLAFLRIVTNPRLYTTPATRNEAWAQVERWTQSPAAWIPTPSERHREILGRCLGAVTSANGIADAHLAALALEHGLELQTADQGFARFRGLRWRNPLRTGQ